MRGGRLLGMRDRDDCPLKEARTRQKPIAPGSRPFVGAMTTGARARGCRGRPGGSVDAGCEPDQVASRAHDLVLRDVPAAAECARLRGSTSVSRLFNSYYVAAGLRHARPGRGLITRPDAGEVVRLSGACGCGGRAADRRGRIAPRCRKSRASSESAQSRGAASGAAHHRHPARVRAEPDRACLRRAIGSRRAMPRKQALPT